MRMRARRLLKVSLGRLGWEVSRSGRLDAPFRRSRLIERHGVTLVLDVGANIGDYVDELRSECGYQGRAVSFEPVSSAYDNLSKRAAGDERWDTRRLALSAYDGRATINVAAGTNCSSFLKPLRHGPLAATATVATEEVETRRLDSIAGEIIRPTDAVLLKLDVQGHESAVLEGASESMRLVQLVECEVPLVPMYEGQATFRQTVEILDDLGFAPVSVEPNYVDTATGHVIDADMILTRRDERPNV